MFKSITWQQFLIVAAILISIYYVIVFILFYRREIQQLAITRKASRLTPSTSNTTDEEKQFAQATLLKNSIEEIIELATHQSWLKDSLLTGLASRIEVYPELRGTPFQIALNNHILQQAQARCNISLHTDDLKLIW